MLISFTVLSCQLLPMTRVKHPTPVPFWLQVLQCQSSSRTCGDPQGTATSRWFCYCTRVKSTC